MEESLGHSDGVINGTEPNVTNIELLSCSFLAVARQDVSNGKSSLASPRGKDILIFMHMNTLNRRKHARGVMLHYACTHSL